MARIPRDAFQQYVALGEARSYATLSEKLGISKRSITKRAARERWQERLLAIESKAAERADARAVESLEDASERHLKTYRLIQVRAIEALRTMAIPNAAAAVRALDIAIRGERLVREQPGLVTQSLHLRLEEQARRWTIHRDPVTHERLPYAPVDVEAGEGDGEEYRGALADHHDAPGFEHASSVEAP